MSRRLWIAAALPLLALCAAPTTVPSTRPADVPLGPSGRLFGDGGDARRMVFLCDGTGSMLNKMDALRGQLEKAIDGLAPAQSFNVIFYYDGSKLLAADANALLPATAENKRKARAFIENFNPTGPTDPIPAMEVALKQQPDLVYFLSDGGVDDCLLSNKEVIRAINQLNTGHKVRINTILFDIYLSSSEEAFKKIAADNGGRYRYVKESDLQQ